MKQTSLRVFIVEDHPRILHGLRRYLQQLGHHVEVATNVASALEQIDPSEVDLLISDISLPDGDGWDLMRRLEPRHRFLAVAMSGQHGKDDLATSKSVGFQHHLFKPFLPEDLEPILDEAKQLIASRKAAR